MNEKELRVAVESAFKKANKKKMLSYELRELLNLAGTSPSRWANMCGRMMQYKIIQKTNDLPSKEKGSQFFYYELVSSPKEKPEEIKKKFVLFNKETMIFEKIEGEVDLDLRIKTLLEKDNHTLEIYQLVEVAEPKRIIGRQRVS